MRKCIRMMGWNMDLTPERLAALKDKLPLAWKNPVTRDPVRIGRILLLLGELWQKYPDWRLGQLIVNVTGKSDPFYVEDDDLEKALRDFYPEGAGDERSR